MRAGGISYFSPRRFSVALPALVLGLVVAVISMLMLCFIVPIYSLKVEEVIYSNIARVIANRIERTHALGFQRSDGTVFNVYAGRRPARARRSGISDAPARRTDWPGMDAIFAIPHQ